MTLKQKIIRFKLIEAHLQEVRKGNYVVAKKLLHLLHTNECRCGLDDVGFQVEILAETAGCRVSYTRNYYAAIVRI